MAIPKTCLLAACLLSCLPLSAQIADLAITDDGNTIYFVSAARQRGKGEPALPGVYRLTDQNIQRIASSTSLT